MKRKFFSVSESILTINTAHFCLLQKKSLKFCGNLTVVSLVNHSCGVFLVSGSGRAGFFPADQAI